MPASQEPSTSPSSSGTSDRTGTTSRACPNCNSTTAPRSWVDLFGYECTSCSGLWIPGRTLARFLSLHPNTPKHEDLLRRANKSDPSKRPLRCPSCRASSFHSLGAVGVELDMCGICGGCYLDSEEVKTFLRTGRSGPTSSAEKMAAADFLISLLLLLP
jgi:Zn-finger nucleic acid-binding protein